MSEEKDAEKSEENELEDREPLPSFFPFGHEPFVSDVLRNPQRLSRGFGLCRDCGEKIFKIKSEYDVWREAQLDRWIENGKYDENPYKYPQYCERCQPRHDKIDRRADIILVIAFIAVILYACSVWK